MTTIQYVAGTALALLAFVMMANFVVFLYARGVVRSAVDEGARAGGPVDATPADCESRAHDVVADLLGGGLGRSVSVSCRESGGVVTARAKARFSSWIPGVIPDWSFTLGGTTVKEREP